MPDELSFIDVSKQKDLSNTNSDINKKLDLMVELINKLTRDQKDNYNLLNEKIINLAREQEKNYDYLAGRLNYIMGQERLTKKIKKQINRNAEKPDIEALSQELNDKHYKIIKRLRKIKRKIQEGNKKSEQINENLTDIANNAEIAAKYAYYR